MVNGLHHIAIICSSERSISFYEALNFAVMQRRKRPEMHDEIVYMEGNNLLLELFIDATHPARITNPEAYGLRHLGLKTKDVLKTVDFLMTKGYMAEPIRKDVNGINYTFVKDPDGLPIELHE